ncbi:376_t:CDS:2 [Diversispora eburnea]|uniref:376_t:CDS:1 n=1 Tax=Diversispora eburnea TaxID=1213867 RepID=A0A9N8V6I7_9GLOM|nr:376_t:CDS:2 [Diversispora eburnea]
MRVKLGTTISIVDDEEITCISKGVNIYMSQNSLAYEVRDDNEYK